MRIAASCPTRGSRGREGATARPLPESRPYPVVDDQADVGEEVQRGEVEERETGQASRDPDDALRHSAHIERANDGDSPGESSGVAHEEGALHEARHGHSGSPLRLSR